MNRKWLAAVVIVSIISLNAHQVLSSQGNALPAFTALSAEADPHTGSANFGVPIEVPPGKGGIQPSVQLHYNSSSPNGILGVGWSLELGSVQRSSKGGVPRYDDTDTFVLIQSGGAQELVLDTTTGLYRGKTEGAFMKIARVGVHWEVTDKSGVKYIFGQTTGAKEYDSIDANRVFKWFLERVEDLHGNYMTVDYFRHENKLYPQDIRYTGNSQLGLLPFARVTFEREARPENDIDHYHTGYRVSTRQRISRITVEVDGHLQRKYDLIYDNSRTTGRSLLTSVVQYGSDGVSSMPPVTFSYQTPKNPDFNYNVTLINSSVSGDNKWNFRSGGGYDHNNGINYGNCSPTETTLCGYSISWGPTTLIGGSNGTFSYSDLPQDSGYWWWTYLYVEEDIAPFTVNYTSPGSDGAYLREEYNNYVGQTWDLKPGYNRVDITLYNQNQPTGLGFGFDLTSVVDLMSSSIVILPQLSGDFNADGRADIATYDAGSGKVMVERSNGGTFAAKELWISGFGVNGRPVTGDFNGDGRMDIGSFDPANGNWKVALSDGSRFNDQSAAWISGFGAGEDPSAGDFNGDGLTDILTFYKSSGNLYVRIALNQRGSFTHLVGGQNILIGSASDTPVVGDFNGDGQVDFGAFNKTNGTWDIRLNTGDILAGLRQLPTVSGFGAGRNTVVSDFNYDGLTDIGYYDDTTGKVIYRVCQGSSFAPAVELPFVFNVKGPNTQIQSGDYNGDTLIDFAVYNLIGKLEIAFSSGVMPDILSSIENGLGGQSAITYDSAVNYPQTFLPFPIQVVKSLTKSNGLGESYTITNSYEQGLWDAQEREFRGFGLVRVTDPDGNYSDTLFAQDSVYKGRVTEQRTHDASEKLYAKTINTWARQEIIPGSDFIYLQRKDNFVYDSDATGKRTGEEFFFEESPQYGNLTRAVQLGEVDLATGADTGNDSRSVETAYVHNTARWLIGLPRLTTVQDNSGSVVRKTWFYYDNNANTSTPDKGFLTKKEDWAGDGNPGETVINPLTQYVYDAAGNLVSTTDPKGNVTTVAYDGAYGMFPVRTTNALGHRVVNEYYGVDGVPFDSADGFRGLWGQLKSTTDPNNQAGRRVYDVFGRATAAVSPLDSLSFPTQTTAIEFLGSYTKVTARQRVEHGKPQTIDTVSFIDGFGRVAQTKTRTEVVGRYVVNGQARYDSRGLKNQIYLPAFSTNPMDVIDAIDDTKPYTTINYDAMGRAVRTTNPDGRTYASVSYDDWTAASVDENGHMQKSYFDAYGRLVRKEEYLGADGRSPHYPAKPYTLYATTLYLYDSEGNLITTIDAHGNTTTITYDKLGRKTAMDDPDMGVWNYAYDLNGNLASQTDAKGQSIHFTYDALNRLVNKTDNAALNVDYTYDDPFVTNAKGRLTQAQYPGGNTRFVYDELGRELQSVKEMNSRAHEVNRGYDALNRLAHVQYPDGENAAYRYNTAGQIEAVASDPTLFSSVSLSAPELNLIQAGSTEVKLNWGGVSGATGYKIKYGTLSGNYTMTLDAGSALNRVISELTNDTAYYFTIAAYNADIESGNSNERSATPTAPPVLTVPSPWVQYAFNDSASNTTVADAASGAYNAVTEQTSLYTSDLTGSGTASASSCWWTDSCQSSSPNKPGDSFDNDTTSINGWVSAINKVAGEWLEYSFSTPQKIAKYVIYPRWQTEENGGVNNDGNPRSWTFAGYNGLGWDILDTQYDHTWKWQVGKIFPINNSKDYSRYRLNISANGGHHNVGLTELDMMAYAPLYTSALSAAGMINSSFNFNGSSHLINADSLLAAKNHSVGSIALWVNSDATSYSDVIFSLSDTDGPNRVELFATPDLEFHIVNFMLSLKVRLPNALIAGLWSHIVFVQDGSGIKGYVNGNEVAVTVVEQGLGLDAWFNSTWGIDNARIGCKNNNNEGNYYYYDGRLDDFRYYDHPLTAAEVKALYNGGSGTEAKNPTYTDYTPLSSLQKSERFWEENDALALKAVIASPDGVQQARRSNPIISRDRFVTTFLAMTHEEFLSAMTHEKFLSAMTHEEFLSAMTHEKFLSAMTHEEFLSLRALFAKQSHRSKGLPRHYVPRNDTRKIPAIANFALRASNLSASIGAWLERNILGVGEAEAQAVLADSFKESTAGLTSIEAENYHGNIAPVSGTPKWDRVTTASQSGAGSMKANPNSGVSNDTTYTSASPRLDYKIKFVKTGTHYIWIRAIGATTADDSVHAGLNGQALTTSDKITGFAASWAWSKTTVDGSAVATVNVAAAGEHTLNLWMREDGIVIDKIVVTTSSTYTPSGTGPAESAQVPPAAPVLNSAVAGDKKVTLSWSAVSGAAGYKVYRGLASRSYGATGTDVGPAKTYTAGNLTNGTKYYFAVVAYNSAGQSIYSNELSATPVSSLAAPVLNSAVAGDGQVSLSWSAVTGASGYRIYYKSGAGSYGTLPAVDAAGATSWTVTGLTNGTAYSFVVVAYAVIPGSPESVSAYSNERSATPVVPPPPAPVLSAATAGNTQADLSWSAVAGATGYKVYYSTTPGQYIVIPPINAGNATAATVTGLANGTTYYFTVTAYNAGGEGPRSNERSATPAAPPPTVTLTADPAVITAGGSTALTWNSTNADICDASGGWTGGKLIQGTENITPALTGTYTLTCTGPGGSASASATVTVNPAVVSNAPTLYVKNVDYNAAGQMTKVEYGNGTVTTYDYDPLTLRLIHLQTLTPNPYTLIQDLTYTYDSAGNILSITDNVNTATQSFQYDELNRLTQAQGQSYGIKDYQYDAIGNILTKDGKFYSYAENGAGPHAVTSLSDGTAFRYDANGNMIAKTESGVATAYTYDAENRLVKVEKNGGTIAQYEYDGDGGRTKKVTAQGTTEFVGALFEKTGMRETRHVFLGSTRVASVTAGEAVYFHADHLGGTNAISDAAGALKELIEYEPFGMKVRHEKYGTGEDVAWHYFTGQRLDDETGLYYFGARYYDPSLGRFITPDSIVQSPGGNPQTFNRYSYAGNNPVNNIDPSGHSWFSKFWKAAVTAIVGTVLIIASAGTLAPVVGTYWAGVATGAMVGATIGGTFAAATGGNIGMGLLTGAVGGGLFAGLAPGLGAFSDGIFRGISLGGAAGPLTSGMSMASNFTAGFLGGAVSGAAIAGVNGTDVGNGALMGGAIAGGFSLLSDTAYLLRTKEIQNSELDPLGRNSSGKSSGVRGDNFKLAGARIDPRNPNAAPAPLGGIQGGQGKIFGFNYPPNGIVNHVLESWAGPHDWLNGWTYDSVGNLRNLNLFERGLNTFTNPLNVAIAAPLAVPLATEPIGYSAPSIIYGESHRNER